MIDAPPTPVLNWTRIITTTTMDAASVAEKIREAHTEGLSVVLTVGGIGTTERQPGVKATLHWVGSLPAVEAVTWRNEPDLNGDLPAVYRRGWMSLRRVLGSKLWWCDCSPHHPLTFTQRARAAGLLPKKLVFAIHPYCNTDPLARCQLEGGIGNLRYDRVWIQRVTGSRFRWAITELGKAPGADQARWWRRVVERVRQVKAKCLIPYTASGPTWNTELTPESSAYLSLRP